MELTLGAPAFRGSANAQFVKMIVDGVLTALHAQADRKSAVEIARRLEPRLRLPAAELEALLLGEERAVLGARQRLIVPRASGVQCQPDDGRIAVLRIELDRSAHDWSITGRLASRANTTAPPTL